MEVRYDDFQKQEVKTLSEKKGRDSNLELFRIITMLFIIAHHYVVNSGLTAIDGPISANPLSFNSLFLLGFGAWGKIGINCFVLITGYFMINSEITLRKFFKLFFEIIFYKIVIGSLFFITGYQTFEWKAFLKILVPILIVDQNFSSCYILFFLFIPFLNILIINLNEKQHINLLIICSITYILFGTFHRITMNYVSWFMVLYIISSYLRLYPKKWMTNKKIIFLIFLTAIIFSSLSIIFTTYLGKNIIETDPYYFVADSNSFLAVITGIFSFLFFLNLKIPQNKFINRVASTTFGIFLIHANSDTMRQWLWKDTLKNVEHYDDLLYFIACIFGVFIVCSIIDYFRIILIEKPFFKIWDNHIEKYLTSFNSKS